MNFTVRWKDCTKSDSVLNYLETKINNFEDFHFVLPTAKVEVVCYPKSKTYTVRINVSVKSKGVIRAEGTADEILTAINFCCEKITDQLRRVKTKFKDH